MGGRGGILTHQHPKGSITHRSDRMQVTRSLKSVSIRQNQNGQGQVFVSAVVTPALIHAWHFVCNCHVTLTHTLNTNGGREKMFSQSCESLCLGLASMLSRLSSPITRKCPLPVLSCLQSTNFEACTHNENEINFFNCTAIRFFMKLFRSSNSNLINECMLFSALIL